MIRSTLDDARAFFHHSHRIAVVGVSRDPKDFSRFVFRELLRRGLDAVPVNPALAAAHGVPAFASVSEVDPPADAAILMVPPAAAEAAVRDCLRARIRQVWLHRGAGAGVATEEVLALCVANRLEVVHGLCPMMALPAASLPHRVHGLVRRAFGHAPPRAAGEMPSPR